MKIPYSKWWIFWGLALVYAALDVWVFSGPLRHRIDSRRIDSKESLAYAKKAGVVAVVHSRPITLAQLERACHERSWLEGTPWSDVTPAKRKQMRRDCLTTLLDAQLLRTVLLQEKKLPVAPNSEIERRLRQLADRFSSAEEMQKSLSAQGIGGEKELRLRIKAEVEQDQFIEAQLRPKISVSEQEAQEFYDKNKAALARPAMVRLRHVFWATLGKESDAVKVAASSALATLQAKQKTFEQLASEMSEDERSKGIGGTLGWITAERLPEDFTAPVFVMSKNQPEIFASKLGWHLVEVLERRDSSPRVFEECREEIMQSLSDHKRRAAIQQLREFLRAEHQQEIHVFELMLDAPQ